tara:strand:- start:512 stop:667 length:156 start_codon:yes stop_codon:yes gene_type:complete
MTKAVARKRLKEANNKIAKIRYFYGEVLTKGQRDKLDKALDLVANVFETMK